jgi:hypothetical protein
MRRLNIPANEETKVVDVCCSDGDAVIRSSLPHGGLFPKTFDSFFHSQAMFRFIISLSLIPEE